MLLKPATEIPEEILDSISAFKAWANEEYMDEETLFSFVKIEEKFKNIEEFKNSDLIFQLEFDSTRNWNAYDINVFTI